MVEDFAPVVLFAYDRPRHVALTLASLRANRLAERTRLIVFCDGPPPDASAELNDRVAETRRIVRQASGFADISIREAGLNQGLMVSVEKGVREVLDEYDRVIVIEDDLELSVDFLGFMNSALALYADAESVMHVSGYMFPVRPPASSTVFLKIMSSWGWATWRRAFAHYETDAAALHESVLQSGRSEEFNLEGEYNYMRQLRANAQGRLRSWAVKWYAAMFLRDGLCLFPHRSLVRNHGHDATGQNSLRTKRFDIRDLVDHVEVAPIPLEENQAVRRAVGRFLGPNLYYRITGPWRRWLRRATAFSLRSA